MCIESCRNCISIILRSFTSKLSKIDVYWIIPSFMSQVEGPLLIDKWQRPQRVRLLCFSLTSYSWIHSYCHEFTPTVTLYIVITSNYSSFNQYSNMNRAFFLIFLIVWCFSIPSSKCTGELLHIGGIGSEYHGTYTFRCFLFIHFVTWVERKWCDWQARQFDTVKLSKSMSNCGCWNTVTRN